MRRRSRFAVKPCTVIAASIALAFAEAPLLANPTAPQVVNGAVSFQQPGPGVLNVTNSPGSIVNWQGFSIGASEVTRFIQQSASSAVLNRVVGSNVSQIYGQLLSNGRVFLINPGGIVVGPGAIVDTAGFVASTLNMLDADFLTGKLKFQGDANSGSIVNQGWIRTGYGGQVVLVAPNIENSGLIHTPGGELILAAGQKLTISSLDLEGVQFEVQAPTDSVLNVGKLLAEGGAIGVFAGTLKHSGDIRATSLSMDATGQIVLKAQGNIELAAGSVTSASGPSGGSVRLKSDAGGILLSGALEANGAAGQGGAVTMQAPWVALGGTVTADASANGGSIAVETGWLSLADRVSARGGSGAGGEIRFEVGGKTVQNLSSLVDASGASGGSIRHVAGQQITTSGTYLANGSSGLGGRIDLSAPATKLLSAKLHADGAAGGGQVRVGGEFQGGKNLAADELPNAELLAISSGSVITADATQSGAGGTVITWANIETAMFGDLSARPAENAAGGFIEISSGDKLTYGGTASAGLGGTVLFDPKNIVIATGGGGGISQFSIVLGYNYVDVQRLKGNDLDAGDVFGVSVSLAGTQLAVGAQTDDGAGNTTTNAGAVYLFNNPFTAPALAGVIGKGYIGTGSLNVSALESGDQFGASVSLSGSQLAVGAIGDAGAGNTTAGAGAVYLVNNPFTAPTLAGVIGKGYTGTGNLDVSALETNDVFGLSVSLSGSQLAVGAIGDDGAGNATDSAGAVYLFNNPFTAPTLVGVIGKGYAGTGNLDVSALEAVDFFGISVSLSGTQLVVGARNDDGPTNATTDAGAVYLFNNPFTAPTLVGVIGKGYTGAGNLDVSALEAGDFFGRSVSLSGTQLAVGANADDGAGNGTTDAGAVYLFNNPFTAPTLAGVIGKGYAGAGNFDVSALAAGDNFGQSVSLAGTQLAVGAAGDDGAGNAATDAGAVYLFNDPFTAPVLAGMIGKGYSGGGNFDVGALAGGDQFGSAVSLSGTQLAVGAPGDDGAGNSVSQSGAVYLFNNPFTVPALAGVIGKGYTGTGNFDVAALEPGDRFGQSASLSGTQLAVGAYRDDGAVNTTTDAGAVYLFNNPFTAPALAGVIGKGYTGAGNFDVSGLEASDQFGSSVSLSGTQLAVGATGDDGAGNATTDAGAVYLFNTPFTAAALFGTLGKGYAGAFDVPALAPSDAFGSAVSLAGTQLAVGAQNDNGALNDTTGAGAVYLFNTPFGTPALAGVIGKGYIGTGDFNVTALEAGDFFGISVSLSGTQLAVGAVNDDGAGNATTDAGAVYLFNNPFTAPALAGVIGKGYTGSGDFDVSALEAGDFFGLSVSLSGTQLAVGATGDDGNANSLPGSGAVYGFNLAGGGGDPVASATFANNPGADSTITPAAITAITNTGSAVVLQANNDVTVNEAVVTSAAGSGGAITMQAGRSVLVSANITTDNGNLSITANDPAAVAANRDAGAGGITMAAGTTLNAGTGTVALTVGAGVSGAASGNLVVENITAANVNLQQTGRTIGSSILRASSSSLITATNLLMEVDFGGLASGGSIGTSAAPIRVAVSNLESHTHEASPGIFIESPTQGLTIGGVPFFGGSVKGVQNVTSGDIVLSVNGTLATQSGTAGCGATGGTGGPICTGTTGGGITLNAADMNIGDRVINAGAGIVRLAPFSTVSNISIGAAGGLSLDTSEIQQITAGTLEIGRSTDTGTLTVASAVGSGDINAGTLTLAHQNIAVSNAINFSAGGENLTLRHGTGGSVTLGADVNVGAGQIDATSQTVAFSGSPTLTSTNPTSGFAAGTVNVSAGTVTLDAKSAITALTVSGGTLDLNAAATANSLALSSGTLTGAGDLTVSGSFSQTGGSQTGTGTTILGLSVTATLGALTLDRKLTIQGTLDLSGTTLSGFITNTGTLNVSGSSAASGGILHQAGTIAVASGQTLTVGGPGLDWQGGALQGTSAASYALSALTFSGTGARVLDGPIFSLSNLTLPGGSLTLQSGALNLSGTTSISSGASLAAAGGAMTATGPVMVGGTLQASAAGPINAAGQIITVPTAGVLDVNGGTVTADSVDVTGGLVKGTGTVAANLNNSAGTVAPGASPGILTVSGNYVQGPSGTFAAEIGGTTPGTQYDQLSVTGNVALDGTLDVVLIGGFVPAASDTFNLIEAGGTLTGTFATTNFPLGAAGFSSSYQASGFDLVSISGSSSSTSGIGMDLVLREALLQDLVIDLALAAPVEEPAPRRVPACE